MTPLERHAAFFDEDGDGRVTYRETFRRMGDLGVPCIVRLALTPVIQTLLGRLTVGRAGTVSVDRIARGKHAFDTGVFDAEGNLDRRAFDALFEGAGDGPKASLTRREMRAAIVRRGDRDGRFGAVGARLGNAFSAAEVRLLFDLAADTTKMEDGKSTPALSRRRLLRFYEGTLLPALARRRRILAARRRARRVTRQIPQL